MFRNILISAGIAGLFAALLLTLLQMALITPLILRAETFEEAATHQDDAPHVHADEQAAHSHEHRHGADEWKPADGLQRTLFTLTGNAVMGVGYALLLVGIYTLWRRPVGHLQGLAFGLAGFAVFFVSPGLGLPPELPGTEAAELGARQQWWLLAAAGAAIGLALLFLQKNIALRILGAAIAVAPHVLGAPHAAAAGGLAPAALQQEFLYATLVGNAVFWLALGLISAAAFRKFSGIAAGDVDA